MPPRRVRVPFPFGGLTTRIGYESSDAQSTSDCQNMVPDSAEESRTRGGSRPGLTKRYDSNLSGTSKFAVRVSGGDNTRVYEYLIIATSDNIFIGQSIADGTAFPITYNESLSPITGNLITEAGDNVITEVSSDTIVLFDFNPSTSGTEIGVNYRDSVIISSDGGYVAGNTKTFGSDSAGESGTIAFTSSEIRLSDGGISNFTNENLDTTAHIVEIAEGSTPTAGSYKIQSITSGYLILQGSATIGTGSVTYTIRNAVRDLNPNTPSIDVLTPTAGFIPLGADDVVSYRDRLVFAKNRTWYMSKQGAPGNFDFSADPEDPSRAVAGTTAGPGEPADPIIAMASAGYDYLVLFSEAAVWVMRGDPGYGGQLYQLSGVAGCISRTAWCYGDSTEIYFLGKDGLYRMAPNAGQITGLSQGKLPRSLRGSDRDNFNVTLVYDPEDNGVLMFIVPADGSQGQHFWYDVETDSFWPVKFGNNSHQPKFAATFGGSPVRARKATLVCNDGFVRDWSGETDDGEDIDSHIVLGPYQASEIDSVDSVLAEISTVVDKTSNPITIGVFVASSAEDAVDSAKANLSPDYTFTISFGRSTVRRPRIRGSAFCLRLSCSGVWAFESLSAMIATAGLNRRV